MNFKLLSSFIDGKGSTILSISLIKIISKIYNNSISNEECLKLIESLKYTNELSNTDDSTIRKIEKFFANNFYKNGSCEKEIDFISNYLINKYNKEMRKENVFYKYLNDYRNGVNKAIESLKEIKE